MDVSDLQLFILLYTTWWLYRHNALARTVIFLTDIRTRPLSLNPCPPLQLYLPWPVSPAVAQPDNTVASRHVKHVILLSFQRLPLAWNISSPFPYFTTLYTILLVNSFSHIGLSLDFHFFQKSSLTSTLNERPSSVPHVPCTTLFIALIKPHYDCLCPLQNISLMRAQTLYH